MKTLVIYFKNDDNAALSYQHAWVKVFKKNILFNCNFLNLKNFFPFYRTKPNITQLKNLLFEKYDCIIILHSAFSNACLIPAYIQKIIRHKKAFKIFFVGNEFKHMPEKIKFTNYIRTNLFITMSHKDDVLNLYKNHLKTNVVYIPSGGFDKEIFYPKIKYDERTIDIGFRSTSEPFYFGHQDTSKLFFELENFSYKSKKKFDISISYKDRFAGNNWVNFLNNCKCLVSSNRYFDYFSLNDDLRNEVNKFTQFDFNKIYNKFFKNRKKECEARWLTGKTIEAAACKTSLILLEGDYGNDFVPNKHYINLNKDFSNLEESIDKLNDISFIKEITNNAYKLVTENYTYDNHLYKLYKTIKKLI